MGLLSRVRANMAGLVFESVEGLLTNGALVRARHIPSRNFNACSFKATLDASRDQADWLLLIHDYQMPLALHYTETSKQSTSTSSE